jgi:hypothetical protein
MLKIVIPKWEYYDEKTGEFIQMKSVKLSLEHSLLSISKWESIWHKAFLKSEDKTIDETLSYIKCMTLTPDVSDLVYAGLTEENINKIHEYIYNPMTATTFVEDKNKPHSREIVTSELIYYWMIALQIPFECEKWHLNRLLTLIEICNRKNAPSRKMSKKAIGQQNASINAARRAAMHSKG